jgi:hypothetical protein
MKVGDLVKLLDDPKVQSDNTKIPPGSLGVIVEIEHPHPSFGYPPAAWVQWCSPASQTTAWLKELQVINAAR